MPGGGEGGWSREEAGTGRGTLGRREGGVGRECLGRMLGEEVELVELGSEVEGREAAGPEISHSTLLGFYLSRPA